MQIINDEDFLYCHSLPDAMPVEKVAKEFHQLLMEKSFSGNSKHDFLQALLELSDRQWHTYEQLSEPLKTHIEKILINEWDGFDFDFSQGAILVAAHLGLVGLFDFISMSASFPQKWLSRSKRQLLSWVIILLIHIVV